MTEIWSSKSKFQIWLEIELYACEAMEKLGTVPKGTARKVKSKAKINEKRIDQIEKKVKHDVIAFLTSISEYAGPPARFLHQGLTSSDILDTAFNIQLKKSAKIIDEELSNLLKSIKKVAIKHKNTLCIGRSHGIHAEPTTFGIKMASFYEEFKRNKKRLSLATEEISCCAISGAVGNYANIDPKVEQYVSKKLGLKSEKISTQIIPRDKHAVYFTTLAIIASSIERLTTEIRHLQRTEVLEVEEFFSKDQKGSSAMPHKRNPVLSENLTGLARLIRSYALPAMENISLWHERDISHSSVERNIGPDANITLDFALTRLSGVLKNIIVYPKKMMSNLNITKGIIFSQELMLELTKSGLSREKSYKIVQTHAKKCLSDNLNLFEVVKKDNLITNRIPLNKIKKIFNYSSHFKNVNFIFNRVFK